MHARTPSCYLDLRRGQPDLRFIFSLALTDQVLRLSFLDSDLRGQFDSNAARPSGLRVGKEENTLYPVY